MMQKTLLLLLVILSCAAAGCNDAVYLVDRDQTERDAAWYVPAKQCSSSALDVSISVLRPTADPARDMWTRNVLITITVRGLVLHDARDEVNMPVTLYWFHENARDPKTGAPVPRTFTDFPNIFSSTDIEASGLKTVQELQNEYMRFYRTVRPDRPMYYSTLHAIFSSIVPEYSTLIESCIYGF